jgi:hypothetical protein
LVQESFQEKKLPTFLKLLLLTILYCETGRYTNQLNTIRVKKETLKSTQRNQNSLQFLCANEALRLFPKTFLKTKKTKKKKKRKRKKKEKNRRTEKKKEASWDEGGKRKGKKRDVKAV